MPQEWLRGREARERENGQESSHSKPSVVCVCVCVDELTKSACGSTTILLFYRYEEIEFQEGTLKKTSRNRALLFEPLPTSTTPRCACLPHWRLSFTSRSIRALSYLTHLPLIVPLLGMPFTPASPRDPISVFTATSPFRGPPHHSSQCKLPFYSPFQPPAYSLHRTDQIFNCWMHACTYFIFHLSLEYEPHEGWQWEKIENKNRIRQTWIYFPARAVYLLARGYSSAHFNSHSCLSPTPPQGWE